MANRHAVNRVDIITGLVVIAIGATAAWLAVGYGIGSARRMGAGFFPLALGLIAIGLGGTLAIGALLRPARSERVVIDPRQMIFVALAFIVFALAINPLGAPLTVFLATALACLGDRRALISEALLLGLGVSFAIWLVFVVILGLALPVWPNLLLAS